VLWFWSDAAARSHRLTGLPGTSRSCGEASERAGSSTLRSGLPCSGSGIRKGDAARSPLRHNGLRHTSSEEGGCPQPVAQGEAGDRASLRTRPTSTETTDDATRLGRSPAPRVMSLWWLSRPQTRNGGAARWPPLHKENREDASIHGSRSDPKTDSLTSAEQEPQDLSTQGVKRRRSVTGVAPSAREVSLWQSSRALRRCGVIGRSFGRGIAGARVLQARSLCAATPRHGSGRRSAPSGADGEGRHRQTRSAPSSSPRPRPQ
jgi:hypothetical protein